MRITEQQLLQIMPHAGPRAGVFVPVLNAAMKRWQIDTPRRIAAFLAQIGHESSQLRNTREIWGPTPEQARYDLRTDLGNTPQADGDGKRYRGRGLIQITGRANYAAVSIVLFGDDRLLKTPELLEQPEWAAESAGWFWSTNGLNRLADAGRFEAITRRINGGLNGQDDRLALWDRAKEVLA
jgi:putative chitinase